MSDVTVKFSAEDQNLSKTVTGIQKDLDRLDSKSKNASKGFDLSFGKIGLAAGVAGAAVKAGMMAVEGATAAASAVVEGFGQAIDLGGKLNDLSERTGESAGNLLILQRAFQNTGVEADKVGPLLNKMQKFLGEAAANGSEQTTVLTELGLSMSDLKKKTPIEQMEVFANKIANVSDSTGRTSAAMAIFGKSGGEALSLLRNFGGEIDSAKGQLGSLPQIMDRSLKAFDDLGDQLFGAKSKTMEFAAGFMEEALPALNAFTRGLAGIDAAGWGQALMKQILTVSDFLIGAFKAPLPAIEAIGLGLLAGVKIAGNNYLNSLIDAGRFAKAFFSSDLPGVISGVLGNTILKVFVDGAKAFIDAIRGVIRAFEDWLGAAIGNVVDFFTSKFSGVMNAVAKDFQAAMSDPIGFVSGKLDSALKAVMENGGNTFQSSFDKAGGSALDKISAGLGAASEEYGNKIIAGSVRAKDEFDKLVGTLGKSDQDFFGAKATSEEVAKKFKEVKEIGTGLRVKFNESENSAAEIARHGKTFAQAGFDFEKALRESEKLAKKIADAEAKNAVDKKGMLAKKADEQIAAGNFDAARRTAAQIAENEKEVLLRGIGKNSDRRAISDIGRDYGMSRGLDESRESFRKRILNARDNGIFEDFTNIKSKTAPLEESLKSKTPTLDAMKTQGSLKDEIARRRAGVDKPGQDGQRPPAKPEQPEKKGLEGLVDKILKLVEKIEPKLPVAALV